MDYRRLPGTALSVSALGMGCAGYQAKKRFPEKKALALLHDLPNQEPGYVLVMIARQFRLILQAKHALRTVQAPNEVARAVGLTRAPPHAVRRVIAQARRFSVDQLAAIHAHVARTDFAIKRSKMDPATALDLLVVGLCSIASRR